MIACILPAWLKLLALDGDLAKAEPKALRYRCCTPRPAGPRRPETAPENPGHLAMGRGDHSCVAAYRRAPASLLSSTNSSPATRRQPRGMWNPGHPARRPGHCHIPALKSGVRKRTAGRRAPAIDPNERSRLEV